jgi:hypothetical protein
MKLIPTNDSSFAVSRDLFGKVIRLNKPKNYILLLVVENFFFGNMPHPSFNKLSTILNWPIKKVKDIHHKLVLLLPGNKSAPPPSYSPLPSKPYISELINTKYSFVRACARDSKSEDYLHLFPEDFQKNKNFCSVWEQWLAWRSESKKPVKKTTAKIHANILKELEVEDAIETINQSLNCGWRGLFPRKKGKKRREKLSTKDEKIVLRVKKILVRGVEEFHGKISDMDRTHLENVALDIREYYLKLPKKIKSFLDRGSYSLAREYVNFISDKYASWEEFTPQKVGNPESKMWGNFISYMEKEVVGCSFQSGHSLE